MKNSVRLSILSAYLCLSGLVFAQGVSIDHNNPSNGEVNVSYNNGQGYVFSATGNAPFFFSEVLTNRQSNLPPGLTLDPQGSGVLNGTPTRAGTYTFTIAVQGSCSCNLPPTDQWTFTMQVFAPLQITTPTTLPGGTVGTPYQYAFTAQGGDPMYYDWTPTGCSTEYNIPPGLCISSAGVLSGTPTTAGTYRFPLYLFDEDIQNSTSLTSVAIIIGNAVTQPTGLSLSGPVNLGTFLLGQPVSGAVNASGGAPPYAFTVTGVPAGMTASGSGISGTPTAPGIYGVSVKVTDSSGFSATSGIIFSVFGIATQSLPAGIVGSPYQFTINAAGGQAPYTFTGTGIPPKFSFTQGGSLNGTPATTGNYTINVTVQDGSGHTASATLPFAVNAPGPLKVNGGALSDTIVQTPLSQSLSATGGAPPYSWSVAGGTFPDGMTLAPSGNVTGTPSTTGSYTFSARATDVSGASGVGTYTVNVKAQPLVILTPSPLSAGMVNVDYPLQVLTASGGSGTYTFAVATNSLPAGLTLDPNGAISGTPTAIGDFTFTITVTDTDKQTGSAAFEIKVRPFSPDLLLSAGSLAFSLPTGSSVTPPAASLQIQSTDVTRRLNFSVAITGSPSWLTVTGAGTSTPGTTPQSVHVALTSAALALAASATPYQAQIVVTCLSPSPCAGSAQTVNVTLSVKTVPPVLTIITDLLSFTTTPANPQATSRVIELQDTGGGSVGIASITCSASWCHVGAAPSFVGGGSTADIHITADPAGLNPGFYYADVTIVSSVGTNTVPVTFFIANNSTLAINPAGVQLTMQAGGQVAVPESTINVSVSGTTPVAWTATLLPGATWLSLLTPGGTSTGTAPGTLQFSVDEAAVSALAAGTYYATIRVSAAGAVNSPQDFQIVLSVLPKDKTKPQPTPAGLLFITTANGTPPPQTDVVFASSVDPVAYQASATTEDGNDWLHVDKTLGSSSVSHPGTDAISVSPAGLNPGTYRGTVTYQFSASGVRSVNVTLIVLAPGLGSSTRSSNESGFNPKAVVCAPAKLTATQTGLVSNFAAPAAWPTPLEISVTDNCGNFVGSGQVVATFNNGDPPLIFAISDAVHGVYSATWTPRHTGSQVSINARATAPGLTEGTTQITGSVVPNVAPVLTPNGTLHVFTPQVGAPLAPGTIVQIYGSQLANQTLAGTTIPLATSLAGTSVIIGGVQAPLFFVSPGQVNAQLPFELVSGQPYQVIVNNNGALSTPNSIAVANVTPGVAAVPSGVANAQHVADGTLITESSPAKPGEYVVLYLAGMGATTVPVAAGAAAPASPLASTQNTPTVTLNGEAVSVVFSGMTPGLAGLYQIDLQIPADAANGDMNLVVTQPGSDGSTVILPVHN